MNNTNRIRWALAAAVSAAFLATPIGAQDKKADVKGGEEQKVIVDNDKVRVTETSYKAGSASAMRERGARVARALTAGKMERTFLDGKKEVVDWKVGDVIYSPKGTFINRNIGTTTVTLYTVTLK